MWKKLVAKLDGAQKVALGAVLLSAAGAANAALPEGVSTAITALSGDAQDVFDLVVPFVLTVLGFTVVIKLIKRFVSKV